MKTIRQRAKAWIGLVLPFLLASALMFTVMAACNASISAAQRQMQEHREALNAFSQSIERQLKEVDNQLSLKIVKNEDLKRFLGRSDESALSMTDYYASRELRAFQAENKLIHSVYMYRGQDGQILSTSYKKAADRFNDREFFRSLLAQGAYNEWSSGRKLSEYPLAVPEEQVISFAKNMSTFSGSDGVIVVNVQVKELFGRAAGSLSEAFYVRVADAGGALLYDNLPQATEPGDESKLARALDETALTGPNWTIESGVADERLIRAAERAVVIRNLTVAAGIFLILALFVVYFRKASKPLRQILGQIEASGHAAFQTRGQDEYAIIGETIAKWTAHMKEYERQQAEANERLKRHFFRELLHDEDESIPPSIMEAETERYGIGEPGQALALIVIEIDGYDKLRLSGRKAEVKRRLPFLVNRWAEEHRVRAWTEWTMNKRLAVMTGVPGGFEADSNVRIAESVFQSLEANLGWSVTIAVGESIASLRHVHKAYRQALFALQHKLTSGGGSVLARKEAAGHEIASGKDFLRLTEEAAEKFKSLSADWEQVLNQYFDELDRQKLSDGNVRVWLALLLSRFEIVMESMRPEIRKFWGDRVYPKLSGMIKDSELLEEIREACLSLLQAAFTECLRESQNRSQRQLARQIRDFIESHQH